MQAQYHTCRQDIRFGASAVATDLSKRDDDLYRDIIADSLLIRDLGYDSVWFAEHNFGDYLPHPSPLLTMAHVAAKAPDLDLGAAVLVLPCYHPMRLASEIAMLSALTRGSLLLGIGRGAGQREFEGYNVPFVDAREQFRETFEVLQRALTGQAVSFRGRFYQWEQPVRMRPAPAPGAPIQFFASAASPAGAETAAEMNLPLLCHSQSGIDGLASTLTHWRRKVDERHPGVKLSPALQIRTLLADTDAEAYHLARRYFVRGFEVQRNHYRPSGARRSPDDETAVKTQKLERLTHPKDFRQYLSHQLVGGKKTVIKRLGQYLDCGFSHFIIHASSPWLPTEVRRDTYRRFAVEIAPAFAPRFGRVRNSGRAPTRD